MPEPTEPTEPEKRSPAKKAAAKKAPAKKTSATSTSATSATKAKATASKGAASKTTTSKTTTAKTTAKTSAGATGSRFGRFRREHDDALGEVVRERVLTPRTVLAIVLFVVGVAWIAYYYMGVRVVDEFGVAGDPTGPKLLGDLGQWNYLIGFGLIGLALIVAAHPSTPLGRGRGVVVGMLACFGVGLLWICTFYVISGADYYRDVPVFNDLEQKNLIVGIGLMAMGFVFATKWE